MATSRQIHPVRHSSSYEKVRSIVMSFMNMAVLVLSVLLIVWLSVDTFKQIDFLGNHEYMEFQFWVCMFFILDFFVGLVYAEDRWRYFGHRLLFLFLSIPYLNIINMLDINLSADALYLVRFIPLARGALALAIVTGYLSSNAVSSLFMSYIVIMMMVAYFCSLIFFQREHGVNPEVDSYWTALWWAAMNMSTVGCNISPVTAVGKIVAVILPITGMIIFPLFTVYLTNYVTNAVQKGRDRRVIIDDSSSQSASNSDSTPTGDTGKDDSNSEDDSSHPADPLANGPGV